MSVNPNDDYPVYLGAWINWSRGPVMGSTLTVRRDDANLLIAFVAFFVAWVGTRFWRIACVALHYAYSSRAARDAVYHQRQALLRNSANPESALGMVLLLIWSWRSRTARSWLRLLLVLAAAVISLAGFTIASGFSSQISLERAGTGDEVLLASGNCMLPNATTVAGDYNQTEIEVSYKPWLAQQYASAASYARECYRIENTPGGLLCDTFVRTRLATTVQKNASCPFHPRLCKSQDANIILDTGLLDSHVDLGINAPPGERFQFRRVMHCAPLVAEGFKSTYNLSAELSYTRYHYGPGATFAAKTPVNYTHQASNDVRKVMSPPGLSRIFVDYDIEEKHAWFYKQNVVSGSTFRPLPDLRPGGEGDIAIIFLGAARIMFTTELRDPWYNATVPLGQASILSRNGTMMPAGVNYGAVEPASPLGCNIREQLCKVEANINSNDPTTGGEHPRCTNLRSPTDAISDALSTVWADDPDAQDRVAWWWSSAFGSYGTLADLIATHGTSTLLSRETLSQGSQYPLPDNQWMADVQRWHEIALASTQWSPLMCVLGPPSKRLAQWMMGPTKPAETKACGSQKIISALYVSFSIFGLAFIFVVGGLIVLASYALDPLLSLLRRRYRIRPYEQLEWRTNDFLQLQRLAHEELGVGTWSAADDHVPVTERDELLGMLDISDPAHPILVKPPSTVLKDSSDGTGPATEKNIADVLATAVVATEGEAEAADATSGGLPIHGRTSTGDGHQDPQEQGFDASDDSTEARSSNSRQSPTEQSMAATTLPKPTILRIAPLSSDESDSTDQVTEHSRVDVVSHAEGTGVSR